MEAFKERIYFHNNQIMLEFRRPFHLVAKDNALSRQQRKFESSKGRQLFAFIACKFFHCNVCIRINIFAF